MQTLVYIIGGYCLIKAVLHEYIIIVAIAKNPDLDMEKVLTAQGVVSLMFLAAIEAFNQ